MKITPCLVGGHLSDQELLPAQHCRYCQDLDDRQAEDIDPKILHPQHPCQDYGHEQAKGGIAYHQNQGPGCAPDQLGAEGWGISVFFICHRRFSLLVIGEFLIAKNS